MFGEDGVDASTMVIYSLRGYVSYYLRASTRLGSFADYGDWLIFTMVPID